MKHLIAIGCLTLVSGCSTPPAQHTPSVQLEIDAVELPEPVFEFADTGTTKTVLVSHRLEMENLVPEPLVGVCGVISQEQHDSQRLANIESALTYRFIGISESWIPINGKPTRYQIYSVR